MCNFPFALPEPVRLVVRALDEFAFQFDLVTPAVAGEAALQSVVALYPPFRPTGKAWRSARMMDMPG